MPPPRPKAGARREAQSAQATTDPARQRIRGYDGLRAAAFLMVFVSHKAPTPQSEALGSAGVWLFFVLSGFLITRILARFREEMEAEARTFASALKVFYLRRTARIMPVYYAFLGVLTLFALRGAINLGEPLRQLSNWLYLANVYIERHGWANDLGHLWSLAVEEQFYLVFAPLALLVARRRLAALCLSLIGVSVLAHLVLWWTGAWTISFDVDTAANFGLLALGGLAGLMAERPLPGYLATDIAIALALAIYVTLPLAVANTSVGSWPTIGRLSGLLAALLLVQVAQCREGRAVRLLETPLLREIGLVSYGAYLIHPVLHADQLLAVIGIHTHLAHLVSMGIELGLALLIAEVSWRLFERPVGAWLRA